MIFAEKEDLTGYLYDIFPRNTYDKPVFPVLYFFPTKSAQLSFLFALNPYAFARHTTALILLLYKN